MNKLAVLAFSLLVFFSFMMWYLANGSLNDYLKSQIIIQGHYYSGHTTQVDFVAFSGNTSSGNASSANTSMGTIKGISITNDNNLTPNKPLVIDELTVEMSPNIANKQAPRASLTNQTTANKAQLLLTTINKININKLVLNVDSKPYSSSNIEDITQNIIWQLANDYPQDYPEVSAKIYARNNPELNADEYAASHPDAKTIQAHNQKKKQRGKPQQRFIVTTITIKTLEIYTFSKGEKTAQIKSNVNLTNIGGTDGLVSNQLGGEILLKLLNLALKQKINNHESDYVTN